MSSSSHNADVDSRQHPAIVRRPERTPETNELTHELAGLLDGSLRHVHLAIDRLSTARTHAPLEHLEAAHDALHQMADLLQDWRRGAPPASHATLGHAARQAVRLVHPLAREQGVALTLELANAAAALPAGALRRVLDNALRNSLEAIEADTSDVNEAPAITVAARIEASTLVLTVTDTGPGLSASVLDEQGRFAFGRSSKAEQRGTGLPLAQRIAEQLGGELTLRHRQPRGATLELRCDVAALSAGA
ncbi:MAG: ATP-binding protein [Phycisphaeraceae bacterium]